MKPFGCLPLVYDKAKVSNTANIFFASIIDENCVGTFSKHELSDSPKLPLKSKV